MRTAKRPAVFLDLNGTLILPILADSPFQYHPVPGARAAVAMLCRGGFVCPVVTVQSRIGKRVFTESTFLEWFGRFAETLAVDGARVVGPYVCPHRFAEPCRCKKPTGLLYRRAAGALDIDLASSFVVGDSLDDMEAAQLLGCRGIAVRTGWPLGTDAEAQCAYVADDVLAAANWIVDHARTSHDRSE